MTKMKIYLLSACIALLSWGCEDDHVSGDGWSVIYPDGREAFVKGTTANLVWKASSSSVLRIELYRNSQYYATIEDEAFNTGGYEWIIPEDLPVGPDYRIKIIDIHDSNLQTMSKNSFRILAPGIMSTFTDTRDGRNYPTVKLGEQTWMAENFKYNPEEGSFCYWDDPAFCEILGRLYTQEVAISIHPEGWHLPSDEEWKELEAYLGMAPEEIGLFGSIRGHSAGEILRPEGGSGFNAIFSGYYNHCADEYGHKTYESHYWSSSHTQDGEPILRIIGREGTISRLASICHMGSSVRYIKDSL